MHGANLCSLAIPQRLSLLLARARGEPLVVLGVLLQHSPQLFITLTGGGLESIHDLANQPLMLEPQSEELLAYLQREAVPQGPIHHHEKALDALLAGKVKAISAYSSYEPYFFRQLGLPYHYYTPRSAGIDFYGDNLFVHANMLRETPKRVEAFRQASMRGWQAAIADPEATIKRLKNKYFSNLSEEFLAFEAHDLIQLMHADLVQIGYMSENRWGHIAQVYHELGLLDSATVPEGFLYQAEPDRSRLEHAYRLLLLSALGGLLAVVVLGWMYSLIRRLKLARDELARSEQRYRELAEQQRDVIWVIDLETERFSYISSSTSELQGYSVEGMRTRHYLETIYSEDVPDFADWLAHAAQRFKAGDIDENWHEVRELRLLRPSGDIVWAEIACRLGRNPANGNLELRGVTRDITQRRQQEEAVRHSAGHDALTGLPNRTLFTQQFAQSLKWARQEQMQLALIFLDLDHFKPVNDLHGHAVGDLLLCEAGKRIRSCLRKVDLVARIGGDEFVILLRGVTDADAAQQVAEKVRLSLRKDFQLGTVTAQISCSQGIALYPVHGSTQTDLMHHADLAMYEAKRAGRDCVQVYDW